MYWDRSAVDWRKTTPRLLGQQFENSDAVDFSGQRGIYTLYDHRNLIYVGRATALSIGTRLRDHTLDRLRSRWDRFSWFGFYGVMPSGALKMPDQTHVDLEQVISIIEALLIELTEPPQNRQQGKGFGGIEYLQKPDPALRKQNQQDMLSLFAKVMQASGEE